jgi:hypothetical protein
LSAPLLFKFPLTITLPLIHPTERRIGLDFPTLWLPPTLPIDGNFCSADLALAIVCGSSLMAIKDIARYDIRSLVQLEFSLALSPHAVDRALDFTSVVESAAQLFGHPVGMSDALPWASADILTRFEFGPELPEPRSEARGSPLHDVIVNIFLQCHDDDRVALPGSESDDEFQTKWLSRSSQSAGIVRADAHGEVYASAEEEEEYEEEYNNEEENEEEQSHLGKGL